MANRVSAETTPAKLPTTRGYPEHWGDGSFEPHMSSVHRAIAFLQGYAMSRTAIMHAQELVHIAERRAAEAERVEATHREIMLGIGRMTGLAIDASLAPREIPSSEPPIASETLQESDDVDDAEATVSSLDDARRRLRMPLEDEASSTEEFLGLPETLESVDETGLPLPPVVEQAATIADEIKRSIAAISAATASDA